MAGEEKREEKALSTRGKFVTGHHNPRTLACSHLRTTLSCRAPLIIKVPKVTVLDLRSDRHSRWAIRSIVLGCQDYSANLINYLTAAWKHSNTGTLSNGIREVLHPV